MTEKKTQLNTVTIGNTNQSSRARGWCFTLNNYEEKDITQIHSTFEQKKWDYVIGKEIGENKTPHLQGYCYAKNPVCFDVIKKILPKAHIEKAKGNKNQNYDYCTKDGDYTTNMKIGPEIPEHVKQYEEFMQEEYKDVKWYPWQQKILKLIEEKPSKRYIYWFWDKNGNKGKSFLCKYIDWKYNAIIANGKQADVFNQYVSHLETFKTQPKIAILDVPRSHEGYVCYSTLEKIKDCLFYSGKYEGGKCRLIPHHLIVFANFEPNQNKMSLDRWIIEEV